MMGTLLIVAALPAPAPTPAVPCWVVKKAVEQHGEVVVESWARAKGISEKEIEKARRCLRQP